MGQKINPTGLRVGIIRGWSSKWYSDKAYQQWLHEDIKVRRFILDHKGFASRFEAMRKDAARPKTVIKLGDASIAKIDIERAADRVRINIHTAKPGMLIGKSGQEIDLMRNEIKRITGKEAFINVVEIRKAETDAQLVAENVASQLERRIAFRRAMKKAVQTSMKFGAKGIKIRCAGRLGGAEMARVEQFREGRVPLHTLRADIDYGFAEAKTTYGIIGVKVWIFKGEVLDRNATN